MAKNSLPSDLLSQLSAAEKSAGLPEGTMLAVLQQETGGNAKYWEKPDTYHYDLNAEGKRIAGHTGKVSTAFGPFGILESTARDPGFGVAPLKDKSFGEQARFASEYLAARSKKGGLEAGLAGYGEGAKYGKQVAARIQGKDAPVAASEKTQGKPALSAEDIEALDTSLASNGYGGNVPIQLEEQKPYQLAKVEEWEALKQAMPEARDIAAMSAYGQPNAASYASLLGSLTGMASDVKPDFSPFTGRKVRS